MGVDIDKLLEDSLPKEWAGVHLNLGELLLVVHSLSNSTRFLPDSTWESLMVWRDMRERVWDAIYNLTNTDAHISDADRAFVSFEPTEAHQLLAIVPVTFRWGVGEDVGFSLSLILHRYSVGRYEFEVVKNNGNENPTEGKAEGFPTD